MARYSIIIRAEDPPDGEADVYTESAILIDVEDADGVARVVEFSIKAKSANGLIAHGLPPVDFALLSQAFSFPAGSSGRTASVKSEEDSDSSLSEEIPGAPNGLEVGPPEVTTESTTGEKARTSRRAKRKKSSTEPGSSTTENQRPYRRMPESSVVLSTLEEVGTVTALATHFGVPRHTAQGWLQRIRKQSVEEPYPGDS
jgi:hypothetical protein